MASSVKFRGKQNTPSVEKDEKAAIGESEMTVAAFIRPTSPLNLKNLVIFVLFFGIIITTVNIYELRHLKKEHMRILNEQRKESVFPPETESGTKVAKCDKPIVWVLGKNMDTGYLNHVVDVFRTLGFESYSGKGKFNVLWSHDYPFLEKGPVTHEMENVWVNHFPGCGFYANKVLLATSNMKSVPKAFKLPEKKDQLLEYVKKNQDKLWVQKNDLHRGVKVVDVEHLDFESSGTFVQEFIQNPLLVDGRKFDIGIYAILTSLNPIRAYINEGEALLRFCEQSYLPFNKSNLPSYVIGDDYAPIWTIPSLKGRFASGLTMKESLNSYLISKGKDPRKIWRQIKEIVSEVYRNTANDMINVMKRFRSNNVYFEMTRFDFVVDEDLNVFLMEANMSPNLSSLHFPGNKPLYEMVIFNLLHLAGVAYSHLNDNDLEKFTSDRDLMSPVQCATENCQLSCIGVCRLCVQCLNEAEKKVLKKTVLEHQSRWSCRRIIPKPANKSLAETELSKFTLEDLNLDKLLKYWFYSKCIHDDSWCY